MASLRSARLSFPVVWLAAILGAAAQDPLRNDRFGDPLPDGAVARLTSLRYRTGDCSDRVLPMNDGQHVIAIGPNKIAIYNITTGQRIRWAKPLSDESDCIGPAAVSPDDGTLIFVRMSQAKEGDRIVKEHALIRWNLRTDVRERVVNSGSSVRNLAFVDDGKKFAVLDDGGKLRVYDAASMERQPAWSGANRSLFNITASPGGAWLAGSSTAVNRRTRIYVWNTHTGELVQSLGCDHECVGGMQFSADGRFLAAADRNTVSKYDLVTGQRSAKLPTQNLTDPNRVGWIEGLTLSPTGTLVAATTRQGNLEIWSTLTERPVALWQTGCYGRACLQFMGEHHVFAAGGHDFAVWNVVTGNMKLGQMGHRGEIEFMSFVDGGRSIRSERSGDATWTWSAADGTPRGAAPPAGDNERIVWAAADRNCAVISPGRRERGCLSVRTSSARARGVDFGEDDDEVLDASFEGRVVATSKGGKIRFWNADSGTMLAAVDSGKFIPSVRLTPDGESALVVEGATRAHSARLYRTHDGAMIRELTATSYDDDTNLTTFDLPVISPDGRRVAFASYRGALIVELSTGQICASITDAAPTAGDGAWYSPDGRYLLMAQRGDAGPAGLYLCDPWRTFTARRLILPDWKRGDLQVAFAPDSKRFITSSSGGLLWDAAPLTQFIPSKRVPFNGVRLWSDLGGDARSAVAAMGVSLGAPDEAVAFLKTMLRPSAPLPADRLKLALANLDHPVHAQREKASKELQDFGWNVVAALRDHLASRPPAEGKSRTERIITALEREAFRADRSLEVLELIGTPAARALLAELAQGASTAPFTQAAKAGVARIDARRVAGPEK